MARLSQLNLRPRMLLTSGVVGITLTISACGGSSSSDPSGTTAAMFTPTTASVAAAAGGPATSGASTSTVQKVNANSASKAEVTAALQAAGVPNAQKWAGEVVEYRPYPTNDPTFAKLRQKLAKYNPPAGVVDQIIAVLTLE